MTIPLPGGETVSAGVRTPAAHQPGRTPAVVLAHGAGTDRRHASIVAIQDGLAAAGWPAVVFNFLYRERGKRVPDPRPVLERCWIAVLDAVRREPRLAPPWVVIGGPSVGGRIATHVAADGASRDLVRGVLLLGFPLHAAGRPGTDRAAHLARITVPMLFVQGTKDAMADPALLTGVLRDVPHATVHWLRDADHGFRVPRRSGGGDASVRAEVVLAATSWLDNLAD